MTPQRLPNPEFVGKPATFIAKMIGITVPATTRALIAELKGVGRDFPLSIEKLCPVLSYYVVKDWREGCERCKQILRYGGMGHTMSIHTQNDAVILEFGLHKPAYRICVNTPTTHGSIGLTSGMDPALTLGCGGFGGNITSDNITPRHLINIKRGAYERRSVPQGSKVPEAPRVPEVPQVPALPLPKAPSKPVGDPIGAEALTGRIDQFLSARLATKPVEPVSRVDPVAPSKALEFVCEDDVRTAIRAGHTLTVSERAIITPSARELGEANRVFVIMG